MKKLVCIILIAFCLCLSGCGKEYKGKASEAGFIKCPEHNVLYYDPTTKVIYYIFYDSDTNQGFGYMSPYISENGYFCKWDDNKIIEIK